VCREAALAAASRITNLMKDKAALLLAKMLAYRLPVFLSLMFEASQTTLDQ